MLQWGRGSVAAEMPRGLEIPLPRLRPASMGPRLGGRGDFQSLLAAFWWAVRLQWGRGSVAAEIRAAAPSVGRVFARASMGPRLGGRGDGS